jgi:hypothetical protein
LGSSASSNFPSVNIPWKVLTMGTLPTMKRSLISIAIALSVFKGSYAFVRDLQQKTPTRSARLRSSSAFASQISRSTNLQKPVGTLYGMWSQDEGLQGNDRFKACVPYFLPLLDGDQFGKYIYERIPPLGFLNDLFIGPLVNIYHGIPFLGVGLFILLTLGTRFNTDMSRNVRFNAQQAALLDVALIFPELIASGFQEDPLPRALVEPCANFVWYVYMSVVVYSVYCNLRGKKPDQVPYLSGSAEMMVGPF